MNKDFPRPPETSTTAIKEPEAEETRVLTGEGCISKTIASLLVIVFPCMAGLCLYHGYKTYDMLKDADMAKAGTDLALLIRALCEAQGTEGLTTAEYFIKLSYSIYFSQNFYFLLLRIGHAIALLLMGAFMYTMIFEYKNEAVYMALGMGNDNFRVCYKSLLRKFKGFTCFFMMLTFAPVINEPFFYTRVESTKALYPNPSASKYTAYKHYANSLQLIFMGYLVFMGMLTVLLKLSRPKYDVQTIQEKSASSKGIMCGLLTSFLGLVNIIVLLVMFIIGGCHATGMVWDLRVDVTFIEEVKLYRFDTSYLLLYFGLPLLVQGFMLLARLCESPVDEQKEIELDAKKEAYLKQKRALTEEFKRNIKEKYKQRAIQESVARINLTAEIKKKQYAQQMFDKEMEKLRSQKKFELMNKMKEDRVAAIEKKMGAQKQMKEDIKKRELERVANDRLIAEKRRQLIQKTKEAEFARIDREAAILQEQQTREAEANKNNLQKAGILTQEKMKAIEEAKAAQLKKIQDNKMRQLEEASRKAKIEDIKNELNTGVVETESNLLMTVPDENFVDVPVSTARRTNVVMPSPVPAMKNTPKVNNYLAPEPSVKTNQPSRPKPAITANPVTRPSPVLPVPKSNPGYPQDQPDNIPDSLSTRTKPKPPPRPVQRKKSLPDEGRSPTRERYVPGQSKKMKVPTFKRNPNGGPVRIPKNYSFSNPRFKPS
jgi:hypothetical protein